MGKRKEEVRHARHKRIRNRLSSKPGCPRLCVYRSLNEMYVQLIDDIDARTLCTFSTRNKEIREKCSYGGNVTAVNSLVELVLKGFKEKGITKVVFDRGGYLYHGRVKALAEGLRKGGIIF